MSKVENFLSPADETRVVQAITFAEKETSGEIRVHIERKCPVDDAFDRAKEVFHLLKMDETRQKNGVLIYLAVEDHKFIICGDKGINDVVPGDFWDCTKDAMQAEFKKGDFAKGLINGIRRAGEQLKIHFPFDASNDTDELSNEISNG